MNTFDTLYKRAKSGAIQYWTVRVSDAGGLQKETGQLGTVHPTFHTETCKGKNIGKSNETTPAQQAELQAESDWNKKRDEGYKSLKDLGLFIVGPTKEAYDKGGSAKKIYDDIVQEKLDKVLPKFNTDANGNIKPMLAKAVDWKKVSFPCYIQPKLDGVRCLMIVSRSGPDLDVKFLSRSGKEYTTLNHIKDDVIENAGPEPFVLDGEIYSDELTFQEITQAVKKQYPNSLKLKFRAYDVVVEEKQVDRYDTLHAIVKAIGSEHIIMVPTLVANHQQYIKDYHDAWVQEGYEGAMIRLYDGTYGQGQRSSHLLKVKEFDETEFEFITFEHGQRGAEDLIAVCKTDIGQEFRAKMVGTRMQKDLLQTAHANRLLDGLKLTVKHFGRTTEMLPRFPIGKAFRDYE